jgi:hypothetical protein
MTAVPRLWNPNSASSTHIAIGTTYGLNALVPTSSPSIAESTEIAGVSTASPKKSDAPNTPSSRIGARQFSLPFTEESASASSAMIPPSPLLSARMISVTYFNVTTIISAQKIAESPPRMFSGSSGMPWLGEKVSLTA